MSLVNHLIKISLTHKKPKLKPDIKQKAMLDTKNQEAPQSICLSASLTVEASLAFPLVLFALLFFLSFFRILQVQQMTAEALSLAGVQAAVETKSASGDDTKDWVTYGRILLFFQTELAKQDCPFKHIVGGKMGFSFQNTSTEGEYIDLCLSYRMTLPAGILERISLPVKQHIRLKKWTGFHGDAVGAEEEEWVYITKDSNVYHLTAECTYLKLSIQSVSAGQIEASYSPCMICGSEPAFSGCYYITEEGLRYHTRLNCSGLKRTVYMLRISQAEGRGCCSRCSGR